MTLQEVADEIHTTRQFVSQLESGKARPDITAPVVAALALAVEVKPTFFYETAGNALSEDQAHFRKLATTKASAKHAVLARGTVFDKVVEYVDRRVRLPVVDIPDHAGSETAEDIERAAEAVRSYWGLGFGPIANMVRTVERAGVVVAFFTDASTQVDALSMTSRRPVIVRNDAKKSPFRQRFDLAHELGHLVLHEGRVTGDRQTESEANRFASAFLLPRSSFLKAFPKRGGRLDWLGIRDLKLMFGVSKAALLYRARSLGVLDENQYRGAVIALKNKGESIEEAEDRLATKEEAEILPMALEVLRNAHGIAYGDLADRLHVTPSFLEKIIPKPDVDAVFRRSSLRLVN